MASTDDSDSDICYLPPTELLTSSSRTDADSRRRTSRSERERSSSRYRSSSRRRYRSGSREFKRERRSRSRSISPQLSKRERRSRRSRSRSNSRESSKYSKYSRQSRNDSGSSSRERQRKYMKHDRRSNSSTGSSNYEKSKGSSIHEGRRRKYSRRSSSSKESIGLERNTNYRSKSRSSSREMKREDGSNEVFNSGNTQRKGEKKTFYCDICLIELNSEDTMMSHANGVKHSKKSSEYEQKRRAEAVRGKNLPEKKIRQIANPEATKKKIPTRLHEKIKEARDPVVGLKYIREFIARSDPEMEPYYECELCGSCGHASHIFGHIMAKNHRQNFVEKIFKREIEKGQKRYLNMNFNRLLDLVSRYNENNGKISSMIRTEINDENYPWPPEKAPWSKAKGGNGIAPVNARKWATSSERKQDDDDELFSRRDVKETSQERIKVEKRGSLPPPNKLGPPKNLEDAKKFIDLGSQMIKMAIDSNNSMEASEKMKLKNVLESMAKEMEQARRKHEKSNASG